MRTLLQSFTFLAIASLVWIASAKIAFGQQPISMRQLLDGTMRPDAEVEAFEHSDNYYPTAPVRRAGPVLPLKKATRALGQVSFISGAKKYDLFDYLAVNRVAGLLVLKDGKVAFEDYELGAGPQTRWASFSMAKSVSSTLAAIALQEGLIRSPDDPVTRYLPELTSSAYDDVTLRNLLQMASGVRWSETYTDPNSDCRKLLDAQLQHKPGASVGYMKTLVKAGPAGTIWNYNSGEINLIGAVIERATGMPLASYLSASLWSRLDMEQDATWWMEAEHGLGLAGAGLSATLRDYGRFGLFVQQDGVIDGKRLIPKGWFQEAGSPHTIGGKLIDYGYLWWPLPAGDPIHSGAFEAQGIFGQRLYINPLERLVIVVLSARPKPTGATVLDDNAFFAAVANTLH